MLALSPLVSRLSQTGSVLNLFFTEHQMLLAQSDLLAARNLPWRANGARSSRPWFSLKVLLQPLTLRDVVLILSCRWKPGPSGTSVASVAILERASPSAHHWCHELLILLHSFNSQTPPLIPNPSTPLRPLHTSQTPPPTHTHYMSQTFPHLLDLVSHFEPFLTPDFQMCLDDMDTSVELRLGF